MAKYKIKIEKEEETIEEKYEKKNRQVKILILLLLLSFLGFIVYEVKFAEKGIFNNGDRYEEYDPNYPIDSNKSNIEQSGKKETSNVVEGITSNILITSNIDKENSNSSNIVSNSNTKSNSNNNTKDTTKPVIEGITGSSVTSSNIIISNIKASDNVSSFDKLKKEYSIDNKTWSTSNKFSNLKSNTTYTVYIRVTDEAGNVSNTYSKQFKTSIIYAKGNVSGVYNRNNVNFYVTQLSNNKIVYKIGPNGSYHFLTLDTSKTTAEKKYFGSWYFDNKNLYAGTIEYTYSGSEYENVDAVFKKVFNTSGTFMPYSKTKCNGYWSIKSLERYMYMVAYTDSDPDYDICEVFFINKYGKTSWYKTYLFGDQIESLTQTENINGDYGYKNTAVLKGYGWSIGTEVTESNVNTAYANSLGTGYSLVKSYTIEEAIELKLTGKIS